MDIRDANSYKKNLEQIEEELQAGPWSIASYVDLVSEKRFLRFRIPLGECSPADPSALMFLVESVPGILGSRCARVLHIARTDSEIELITPHAHLLHRSLSRGVPIRAIMKNLLEVLARLEAYHIFALDLSAAAIGIGDGSEVLLLPNAYALPFSAHRRESKKRREPSDSLYPEWSASLRSCYSGGHAAALARVMRELVGFSEESGSEIPPQDAAFRDLVRKTASRLEAGDLDSLVQVHEIIFGEPLPEPHAHLRAHHRGKTRTRDAEACVKGLLEIASQGGGVAVLKGSGFSGKSYILEKIAERLEGEWRVIKLDEWNIFNKLRKRFSSKGKLAEKCAWLVDDIEERALAYSHFVSKLSEDLSSAESLLLLTTDPEHESEETKALLEDMKGKYRERFYEIVIGDTRASSRSPEAPKRKVRPALGTHRLPDPGESASAADRLRRYLDQVIRQLSPHKPAMDNASLRQLILEMLASLLEEERQLMEFVSVARIAMPLDVVLSIFASSDGRIQRCIHHLAALGLVEIIFRSPGIGNGVSIFLASRSTTIRHLIYESIPEKRRKNLHRTVALHAEEQSAFPTFFLVHHFMEGGEKDLVAKYCVSYLRDTSSEDRHPLIIDLCNKQIQEGLHELLAPPDRLFALHELSAELLLRGDTSEAEKLLLLAKKIFDRLEFEEKQENTVLGTSIFRQLADTWESKGEYKKSIDLLTRAKEELQSTLAIPDQARLLNDIGWLQYRLGNYESSMESCKLSLATLNANEHPSIVAQALNIMGVVHFNTSCYDEAISYYEQSTLLREHAGDENALAASYNNLALAYQTKGEYDKALSYYQKSLEIKRRQNNQAGIAAAYLNLSLLYLEMRNFKEAEKRCRESLEISTLLGIAKLTAEIYSTLGDIACARGKYEEGEKYYLDSLRISSDLEAINEEMGAHRRLSTLYLMMKKYDRAREHVEQASRLALHIGSKYESAQIDMILGDLEYAQDKHMEALEHYEKAASAFSTLSKNRLAALALARIGLLHARSGNTFEAKQYFDRAQDQMRSDFGHEPLEEIISLQREIRDHPSRQHFEAKESRNLLTSFYELSSLFDSAFDRRECFRRIIDLTRNIIGPDECRCAIKADGAQFTVIDASGEEEPLHDPNLTALFNRTLLLGRLLDNTSPDVSDLAPRIEVGSSGFVCIPLKTMGKDLGCLLFYMSPDALPLSKDDVNFFTALGRHIAGILMLMFHLEERVRKEQHLETEVKTLKAQVEDQYRFENLIGKSEAMKKIFRMLDKINEMDPNILIIGESGTGKTELARAIHHNGPRRNRPFRDIHCAAIPSTLIESELFGYERGAFTGAVGRKLGLCEKADGGTIFLDDINVIPLDIQTKLLNFLESKSFMRLGGTKKITSDVQIIAASNEDLEELCQQGRFRKDLYFRLKVIQIKIPPLRERKEDILAIALSFLKKRCSQQGKPLKTLASETIRLLQSAPWLGNVRELLNVLENVVLMSEERVIYPNALPEDFLKGVSGRSIAAKQDLEALIQKIIELGNYSKARPLMPQIEAILAKRMVDHVPGKSTAAGLLGITKPTLYARLNDYKRMQ